MADPPPPPSLFSRICCCYNNGKQPPVELIRSASFTPPQRTISPAKETVGGAEELNLDLRVPSPQTSAAATANAESVKAESKGEDFAMNDIMMDEICAKEENTDVEQVQDAVSIRTDVIEEVDEEELKEMTSSRSRRDVEEETPNERVAATEMQTVKEDRDAEEAEEDMEEREANVTNAAPVPPLHIDNGDCATTRSAEVVSFEQMIEEGYESPRMNVDSTGRDSARSPDRRSEEVAAILSARSGDESDDEGAESDDEREDEVANQREETVPAKQNQGAEPANQNDDAESDVGEIEEVEKLASSSPLAAKLTSIMYAESPSEDEESDDEMEGEREILTVPERKGEGGEKLVPSEGRGQETTANQSSAVAEDEQKGRIIARLAQIHPSGEDSDGEIILTGHEEHHEDISSPPSSPSSSPPSLPRSPPPSLPSSPALSFSHPLPPPSPTNDLIDLNSPKYYKDQDCVTRLSLKSNGHATLCSPNRDASGADVRVSLDASELTDEEFSEKLI